MEVGGDPTGWFVTVANFVLHFWGGGDSSGKVFDGKFSNAEMSWQVQANWEHFCFLYILAKIMHLWFLL